MAAIDELVYALQDTTVAQRIGNPHDEARMQYHTARNTVRHWREFEDIIADYWIAHYGQCVAPGARLSRVEALGQAKEILEREYRRRHSDIAGAFVDARDGTNSGLRGVLDALADGIKDQSIRHYATDQFDSRVSPHDFEAKVMIIRDFIARFGAQLGDAIQRNRPERYAQDYRELIEAYVEDLRQTSSIFRRL
jgi:hypothetical protein